MSRKQILRLAGILLSAVIASAAMLPAESSVRDNSRWMENLPEEAPLNTLTIPGTHDSGALYSFAGVAGKCQSVSVGEQLEMGVRFLDIRLKLHRNELKVVHSFADQKLAFADVLEEAAGFIRENPTEFLIISIKEDDAPYRSDAVFSDCVEEMLAEHGDVIVSDRVLPETVADARGKIFILSRYADASVGIPAYHGWADSASFVLGDLYVQDHYEVSDASDKMNDIRAAAETAASGEHRLVLNFTSCYLDHGFPPLSAAVPARAVNPWLEEWILSAQSCPGVFICDYMTSDLAALLAERNMK